MLKNREVVQEALLKTEMDESSGMLLKVENLSKHYRSGKKVFPALRDVSFSIYKGETVALIGESGSGKSTLCRLLLQLEDPTSGSLSYPSFPFSRKKIQIIFQDPYSSLNPKMSVGACIAEGLDIHQIPRGNKIEELLVDVGLDPNLKSRYPRELSGGQRQRVSIARALALEPELILCDEPLASLDPMNQRRILDLFLKLKKEKNLSYLFITHDLNLLPYLADRVLVLQQGRIVEQTSVESFFSTPNHPYSKLLLTSMLPIPSKALINIELAPNEKRQSNI